MRKINKTIIYLTLIILTICITVYINIDDKNIKSSNQINQYFTKDVLKKGFNHTKIKS